MAEAQAQTLALAVPVFNERDQVQSFLEALGAVLSECNVDWSVVFVDDGSTDGTADVIQQLADSGWPVELIKLTRNFGKEAALTAALDHANADAVIPMDVDLQDPPEVIPPMLAAWRKGADVVHAHRRSRDEDTRFKRTSARLFYFLMKVFGDTELPVNVGDFRLLDRKVVLAIRQMRERSRYMKGILSWPGFTSAYVNYDRPGRSKGRSKQTLRKLGGLALDGLFSFSAVPLRVWAFIGAFISLFAFVYMAWVIVSALVFGNPVNGYASLMTTILFIGGMQLLSVGVLGEYLSRVYIEVKQRPIYLIDSETKKQE